MSSADALVASIDRCLAQVERGKARPGDDKRLELGLYCPDTLDRIVSSDVAPLLSHEFDEVSSIADLRDIRQFVKSSRAPVTASFQLDYSGLDQLLKDTLRKEHELPKSWWDQFVAWLKQYLPESEEEDYQWLVEFLEKIRIPQWVADTLFDVSMILIILIALGILANEWRYLPGTGWQRRRKRRGQIATPETAAPINVTSLLDIQKLPLYHQLPALLLYVIANFEKSGDLPAQRSFTNRELLERLAKNQHDYRDYFFRLVSATESIVYGNQAPRESDVSQFMLETEKLLEQ